MARPGLFTHRDSVCGWWVLFACCKDDLRICVQRTAAEHRGVREHKFCWLCLMWLKCQRCLDSEPPLLFVPFGLWAEDTCDGTVVCPPSSLITSRVAWAGLSSGFGALAHCCWQLVLPCAPVVVASPCGSEDTCHGTSRHWAFAWHSRLGASQVSTF